MFLCVETPGDFRKIFGRVQESDDFMLKHANAIHLNDATGDEVEDFVDRVTLGDIRHLFHNRRMIPDAVVAFVTQRHPSIATWTTPTRRILGTRGDAVDFSEVSETLTDHDVHRFLLRHGSMLRSITLSHCPLVTEATMGCIAAACASNLEYLRADHCVSLSGSGVSMVLRRCRRLSLHEFSFRRCENLLRVTIPAHIRVIPQGCFCFCTALRRVVVPPNLLRIEQAAFWGCEKLRSCDVDSSVTQIDPWAFAGCGLLYPQDAKWTKMYDM